MCAAGKAARNDIMAKNAETRKNRAEHIVLSERDTTRVLKLLDSPPKPTPALHAAVRRRAAWCPAARIKWLRGA